MAEDRARVEREIARLLRAQSGVVSRGQVVAAGGDQTHIRRMVRRREWARLMEGVYVDHTGKPSWRQRAWAGVLRYEPASLGGHAAIHAAVPTWRHHRDSAPIVLAIAADRHLEAAPGYRLRRVNGLDDRALWHTSPPRLRVEHAGIDLAADAPNETAAVGLLADLCQSRAVTPERLAGALAERLRVPRKAFLMSVLDDLGRGTCSVLEHGYLTRVERPHALPPARWQPPDRIDVGDGSAIDVVRDADYAPYPVVVELNGRMFHDDAEHYDADLERDLHTLVGRTSAGRLTARLGWGQVFDRPCRTAESIGALLNHGGWKGRAVSCPACRAAA